MDLVHDHLTFGFKAECPACEQHLSDLRKSGVTTVSDEVFLQIAGKQARRWQETLAILAAS